MKNIQFNRLLALVLVIVMAIGLVGTLTGCPAPTSRLDEVVGYTFTPEDGIVTLTMGDLHPDYLETGFPNDEVSARLRQEFTAAKTGWLAEYSCEFRVDEPEFYHNLVAFAYEPIDSPGTTRTLYQADLHPLYACRDYGDETAKYVIDWARKSDGWELPNWLEISQYEAVACIPSFWEDFSESSSALTVFADFGGYRMNKLYTKDDEQLTLRSANFIDKGSEGYQFYFDKSYWFRSPEDDPQTFPCELTASYENNTFQVKVDFCQECLEDERRYNWCENIRLSDCFTPFVENILPVETPKGEWDTWDEMTCVFQGTFNSEYSNKPSSTLTVFNCRKYSSENTEEYATLFLIEGSAPVWVEGVLAINEFRHNGIFLWAPEEPRPACDLAFAWEEYYYENSQTTCWELSAS